jgi:hypothetical protein
MDNFSMKPTAMIDVITRGSRIFQYVTDTGTYSRQEIADILEIPVTTWTSRVHGVDIFDESCWPALFLVGRAFSYEEDEPGNAAFQALGTTPRSENLNKIGVGVYDATA